MRRFLAGLLAALMVLSLCACGAADAPGKTDGQTAAVSWDELVFDRTMPLRYAEQFSVEYAGDSYKRITINNDRVYLLVAEGAAVPDGVPTGVTVLQQPLDQIYLVAAAAMDYFDKLNAIDCITLSGKKQSDWYIQRAKDAMDSGALVYAGKYSEPDYELILSQGCDLAVENTMIYHSPAVLEQLERLGIPVLVETSSYETQPLGRMEWIKLYAALLDKEDEAEALFNEKMDSVADRQDRGIFLHHQQRRCKRPQIHGLCGEVRRHRWRRLCLLRRIGRGQRSVHHQYSDGILLPWCSGRRCADLQQHHRRRAAHAGRIGGTGSTDGRLQGRQER